MKNNLIKKTVRLCMLVLLLHVTAFTMDGVSIGGHAGITLLDAIYGKSSNGLGVTDTTSDYAGFKFLKFILFVKYAFTGNLSVDVRPDIETKGIDGTTGATPKFGKRIGDQRAHSATVAWNGFTRAAVTYVLPTTTELSFGYLNARLTWDYGNELFWEDEMNGSMFTCNPWLGEMRDAGIEVQHYFDIGETSLPVNLYIVNGSGSEEVNFSPVVMIGAEPQFGSVRFHIAGAGGCWDENDRYLQLRGSAGMSIAYKKFTLRTEGAVGYWEKRIAGSPDAAIPHGAYLKMTYPFSKHIRISLGASYAFHNFAEMYDPKPGKELYKTITPAVQVITSSSSRIIVQCDIAHWTQTPSVGPADEKELTFIRGTIGWRLTF